VPQQSGKRDRQVPAGGRSGICQRNIPGCPKPAHHLTGDWNPVTAFHHIVTLSQVAHWFRDSDVVLYATPPPDFSTIKIDTSANLALAQAIKAVAQTQAQLALPPPTE